MSEKAQPTPFIPHLLISMPLTTQQLATIQSVSPEEYQDYDEYLTILQLNAHTALKNAYSVKISANEYIYKFYEEAAIKMANSVGNTNLANSIVADGLKFESSYNSKNLLNEIIITVSTSMCEFLAAFNVIEKHEVLYHLVDTESLSFAVAIEQALVGSGGVLPGGFLMSGSFESHADNYGMAAMQVALAMGNKELEEFIKNSILQISENFTRVRECQEDFKLAEANLYVGTEISARFDNMGPDDAEYQAAVWARLMEVDKAGQVQLEQKENIALAQAAARMLAESEADAAGVDPDPAANEWTAAPQHDPAPGPTEVTEAPVDGGVTVVAESPMG